MNPAHVQALYDTHQQLVQAYYRLQGEHEDLQRRFQESQATLVTVERITRESQDLNDRFRGHLHYSQQALAAEQRESARLGEDNRHLRAQLNHASMDPGEHQLDINDNGPRQASRSDRRAVTVPRNAYQRPAGIQQQQQQQQQMGYSQLAPAYGYQGTVGYRQPLLPGQSIDLTVDDDASVAPGAAGAGVVGAGSVIAGGPSSANNEPQYINPTLLTMSRTNSDQTASRASGPEPTQTPETPVSPTQGDSNEAEPAAKRRRVREFDWLPAPANRHLNATMNGLIGDIAGETKRWASETDRRAAEQYAREQQAKKAAAKSKAPKIIKRKRPAVAPRTRVAPAPVPGPVPATEPVLDASAAAAAAVAIPPGTETMTEEEEEAAAREEAAREEDEILGELEEDDDTDFEQAAMEAYDELDAEEEEVVQTGEREEAGVEEETNGLDYLF